MQEWAKDPHEKDTRWPAVSDAEVERAVKDAFIYDPRVMSFDVTVEASGGDVTLRGVVDNLQAKQAAARTARNTRGVISVDNRVKVRTAGPLVDEELEDNVRTALVRDPYTESHEITVAATNGIVDLYGSVDNSFEKFQAEDVVSRVKGVTAVDNNLLVDSDDQPFIYDPYVDTYDLCGYGWYRYGYQPLTTVRTDADIRDDIRSELWWSPFVDADEVTVTVDHGEATLTGQVDSWSEKRSAAENAIEGGATSVVNQLTVQ